MDSNEDAAAAAAAITQDISGAAETSKSSELSARSGKKKRKDEGNDGDNVLVDGMRLNQQEKALYTGAKSIAAASKAVLEAKDNPWVPYFKPRPDGLDEFDFSNSKHICDRELEYYRARSTPLQVLQLLQEACDTAPEWSVTVQVNRSAQTLHLQEQLAAQSKAELDEAHELSKRVAKSAHENNDQTIEIISRPGLLRASGADFEAEKRKKRSNNKKRPSSSPSPGHNNKKNSNNDDCSNNKSSTNNQQPGTPTLLPPSSFYYYLICVITILSILCCISWLHIYWLFITTYYDSVYLFSFTQKTVVMIMTISITRRR